MKLEKASREEMLYEAVQRIRMLKLHDNVVKDLKNNRTLNKSEGHLGGLYWLNEEEENMVKKYEEQYNVFVFHVIKTYTVDMGIIYDLLFLTEEKEYWEEERLRLKIGYVLSYTISQFKESGDIFVENRNGGLVRIY